MPETPPSRVSAHRGSRWRPPALIVEGIRGTGAGANTLARNANGNVLVGGSAADSISSGAGSDIICGGAGNDSMHAGNGIDIIRGDQGDDTLTGGAGGDIFKMRGTDGNDTITDFAVLSDKVEFQVAGVTGFGDLVFQDLGGGNSKVTAGDGQRHLPRCLDRRHPAGGELRLHMRHARRSANIDRRAD